MARKRNSEDARIPARTTGPADNYDLLVTGISGLLDEARRTVVRSTNSVIVAAYWEIGRRIVEHEQGGCARAEYGEDLVPALARDLTRRYGRGFSARALYRMREFYLERQILPTLSAELQLHDLQCVTHLCSRFRGPITSG